MDTLTHALSGALMARAVVPARPAYATRADCVALGFLAAAFPDSDVVLSYVSPLAYLHYHRGVTHSLLLLPLWAFLLAWVWSRLRRRREAFRSYLLVAVLGIGMHILGDLITSFGTMIFAPLTDLRVAWNTTFIIDPWLSGIVAIALLAAALFRGSRIPALLGVAALCGYIGFQALQRQRAIDVGEAHARSQSLEQASVSALPRPVSPFNWMVIVDTPGTYHYSFVNLRRSQVRQIGADDGFIARLDAPYRPVAMARWETVTKLGDGVDRALAEQAFQQPAFRFFRWFAAYPVLAAVERGNPSECVWFQDLRFLTPGRDGWPFRYGMCRENSGPWQPYQALAPGESIALSR
ncbi:MAG: metal-dependent hydrolase [Betaproteobacteria bacterium]|nr:metal-dependent hydrolase [Betaproteobacteria bacterium]